jgi:ribonuclease HII
MKTTHYVGIDEAGRGPLAGPVAVGVVKIPTGFDWQLIPGVDDSKKLSPEKRAEIFARARELRHTQQLNFAVSQVGPSVIDNRGIAHSIRLATNRCLARLELQPETVKKPEMPTCGGLRGVLANMTLTSTKATAQKLIGWP